MEYQTITMDKTGRLLHAGVYRLGRISRRTIVKLERKWMVWRRQYVAEHAGDYPLAAEIARQPAYVTVFPVNSPLKRRGYSYQVS